MATVDGFGVSSNEVTVHSWGAGTSSSSPNAFQVVGAGTSFNVDLDVAPEATLLSLSPDPVPYGTTLVVTGVSLDLVQVIRVEGVSVPFEIIDSATIHVFLPLITEGVNTIYAEYV